MGLRPRSQRGARHAGFHSHQFTSYSRTIRIVHTISISVGVIITPADYVKFVEAVEAVDAEHHLRVSAGFCSDARSCFASQTCTAGAGSEVGAG
jgi:hypothetical protein